MSRNKKLLIRKYCNDIPVYGIPHPSSARGISNEDRALIGNSIYRDLFEKTLPEEQEVAIKSVFQKGETSITVSNSIQMINQMIIDDKDFLLKNDFLEIESKDTKTVRLSFNGISDEVLALTITSVNHGYIGIRAHKQAKGKDFNADLRHKNHYVDLLQQLNFSEDTSWLGRKAIKDLELQDGEKDISERLIDSILAEVNQFRKKLKE